MRWRGGRARSVADPPCPNGDAGVPQVEGYRDLEAIGRGATSTVYRAHQEAYERLVALKVLHVDVSDRRAQRRFDRERSLNGRLSHHPNVVTVLDSGFVDGRYPFLAMELFELGSLADRLATRGPFELATALEIGVRIAGALETAHRIGVLHRDVKPQNVLVSRYGEPALADFGIAALLEMEHSMTAGLTPVHAAPEILEGADPTPQSDVYALGSTIYTVLAGAAPFAGPPGEGILAQLLRITTSDLPALPRADVPEVMVDVLRQAMAKRPGERFASAAAMGQALQDVQRQLGYPVTTLPVERPDELPPARVEVAGSAATPSTAADDTIDAVPAPVPAPPPAERAEPPLEPPVEPVVEPVVEPSAGEPGVAAPTVLGRQQFPASAPASGRTRRWPLAAAAVATAGLTAVVAARVLGDDGEAAPPPTATTSAASVATATVPASTVGATGAPSTTLALDAFVPTDLEPAIGPDRVVLTWQDQTDGRAQHLVLVAVPGETAARLPAPVPAGVSSYAVPDLDPAAPACFQVRAVIDIRSDSPDDTARTADSEMACINGATPAE